MALRQTSGFTIYLFKLMELKARVPNYTTLFRRMSKLLFSLPS
ncbi:transposase [Candidatus Nanoperiomorbus periodonticus]